MVSALKNLFFRLFPLCLILFLLAGCSGPNNPVKQKSSNPNQEVPAKDTTQNQQNPKNPPPAEAPATSLTYKNKEFGFKFTLPLSWQGYTIVTNKWEGNDISSGKITENGPMISIRHPLWTSQIPRQDIPIIVFTKEQWTLLQQEKFHIGAAPIGPKELGSNNKYVFALPARYNYAFPSGYEEVEKILESQPLQALNY